MLISDTFLETDSTMIVQGYGQINLNGHKPAQPLRESDKEKGEARKSHFSTADTYEPSGETPERTELLDEIRKKIKEGFYNSESVVDDISYGFADAMNQI